MWRANAHVRALCGALTRLWGEPCVARTLLGSRFGGPHKARPTEVRELPRLVRAPAPPHRIAGFPYCGFYRYHLRFATDGRAHLFVEHARVASALAEVQRTADEDQFAVLAYCFMPDHLHLVVEGRHEASDMRRFAKVSKQRVRFVFRMRFEIRETWQEGYFDRVLRSDEATEVVVRYVLDNPVRAGLVETAEDYPFSGALFWP